MHERLRALSRQVSNWGRWGPDDERGTVNFITPETIRRGAAAVRRGVVFSLGLPLGADGPQIGQGGRFNPIHLMLAIDGRLGETEFRYADDLVVRTGHLGVFTVDHDRQGYMKASPGLGVACVEWLHAREVAAVATDTMLVEVMPWEDPTFVLPLHLLCIRDMGLTLGEMFDLDELAADCARDGVWEFLFSAPPLKVVGGVGSPLNPLAVK